MFVKSAKLMAWRPKAPLCTEQSVLRAEAVQVPCVFLVTLSKLLFEGYTIFQGRLDYKIKQSGIYDK